MTTATIYVPPTESRYLTDSARLMANTSPSLGPEWIRHVVSIARPQHDVRVLYGEPDMPVTLSDVLRQGDAFLGLSCTSLSYGPVLRLIEECQRHEVPVVVGGPHARIAARRILRSRPWAMIVPGAGERPIIDLLDGVAPREIPGLLGVGWGRCAVGDEARVLGYEVEPFLHQTTDYQEFWTRAGARMRTLYRDGNADGVISVRGINGCFKPKPCSFCTVERVRPYDARIRGRYLARERSHIFEHFGRNVYIRDCSDALPSTECLNEIADELPPRGDERVYCGAMAWDLMAPGRLDAARRAGYSDYLIGLECFSPAHLAAAFKPPDTQDQLFALLERTRGSSVQFFVSGILGWPGESPETLRQSQTTIERLLEYPNVKTLTVNMLLPLPGSSLFCDFVRQGLLDGEADHTDLAAGFIAHLRRNCPKTSWEELLAFQRSARALDRRVETFTGYRV